MRNNKINQLIGIFWTDFYYKMSDINNPSREEIDNMFWCVTAIQGLSKNIDDDADTIHNVLQVLGVWCDICEKFTNK